MEIRRLIKADLPLRVKWMNHPNIFQSMHYQIPVLIENTEHWFECISVDSSRCDVAFVEDGDIVAMGGLTHLDKDVLKAELYIFVNPYLQKLGIGAKAVHLLCQYGFSTMNLNKIYLITNEDNTPARKVYTKCGFHLEGIMREEYLSSAGCFKNRLYYGLLKRECNE